MQYISYMLIAILVPVVLKSLGKSKSSAINNEGFKVMKLSKGYA